MKPGKTCNIVGDSSGSKQHGGGKAKTQTLGREQAERFSPLPRAAVVRRLSPKGHCREECTQRPGTTEALSGSCPPARHEAPCTERGRQTLGVHLPALWV